MTSPAAPFHAAQEAALRASAALATAMGVLKVYTVVPANATLPYLVIGDDTVVPEFGGCVEESEITATVSWWSKPAPPQPDQARTMGAAIINALATDLTLIGHVIDEYEVEAETYSTDPDGSTHGRAIFRYLLTETV